MSIKKRYTVGECHESKAVILRDGKPAFVLRPLSPVEYGKVAPLAIALTRAHDCHDDLLAAAKGALHVMRKTVAPRDSFTDAADMLDAAITKAGGGTMTNVRNFLDLSTIHLSPASRDMLATMGWESASGVPQDFLVGATAYGWFVSANPFEAHAERPDGIPEDLWRCMEHAKANGCDHILFDADAEADPDLPVFDEHAA